MARLLSPISLFSVLLWLALVFPLRAQNGDAAIQRHLAHLQLGDRIKDIESIYQPLQAWPSYVEPRGRVNRIRLERGWVKAMPPEIGILWLGMKKGRLVEIQIIYTAKHTRTKSAEALAEELALLYGEPHRDGGKFTWTDGATVLRAMYAELPVLLESGGRGLELRTSLQVMDAGLSQRTD